MKKVISILLVMIMLFSLFNIVGFTAMMDCDHTNTTITTTPATCTEDGKQVVKCNDCGDETVTILVSKGHQYTDVVEMYSIMPTCTVDGGEYESVYCYECQQTFVSRVAVYPASGHYNYDGDAACDMCGKVCQHKCHNTGIVGFFWKITNFFNSLLKTEKYCECGVAHY